MRVLDHILAGEAPHDIFVRFNGDRINDHHLTLAEKRAAREDRHAQ